VINFVTVHWQSAKWIDVQLDYLQRNVAAPFRVYASLNGIDDPAVRARFHYAADVEGIHAEKLNALAAHVIAEADPTDPLVFIDGDAFPVRPLVPWIADTLAAYRLAAVRRDDNLGDRQPHPCFCLTTVGLWGDIDGDWRKGGTWVNAEGRELTDVGGNLLVQLRQRGIEWLPLLRTNTTNLHPLFFGVYGHRVYHHGAGFRDKESRLDMGLRPELYQKVRVEREAPSLGTLRLRLREQPLRSVRFSVHHLDVVRRATKKTLQLRSKRRTAEKRERFVARGEKLSDEVFARLRGDPGFYRDFDADAG